VGQCEAYQKAMLTGGEARGRGGRGVRSGGEESGGRRGVDRSCGQGRRAWGGGVGVGLGWGERRSWWVCLTVGSR
jgi:hypothetical protein